MEKEFKEWLEKNYESIESYKVFYREHDWYVWAWFQDLPFEFQWGVYLKYYDEKGIHIEVLADWKPTMQGPEIRFYRSYINQQNIGQLRHPTREEAQKAALEKAKELTKEWKQG